MSFRPDFDESPKKFDRVVAILIQLQSKRIVRAQDLADRFGVSLRTIYRDIRTLEASGVPIASEAGVGYSIVEGYKLPPVMFSREEAISFLTAEKLMNQFSDKSLGSSFQSAMYKVKSVLRWSEKDLIDDLDEKVLVQTRGPLFNKDVPNALEVLMQGIVHKKQVRITYKAFEADQPTERIIEPIGLYHEHEYWYLMAYCHLRKDHRKFRADRIYKIVALDTDFGLQHQPLSFYLSPREPTTTIPIRLRVDPKVSRYLSFHRKFYGFVNEVDKGSYIEMNFQYGQDPEYFIRWIIMLADKVDILEPESLRIRLGDLARVIYDRAMDPQPMAIPERKQVKK